ncbi:hypothetical protein [Parasediminibacterium sp. JCM 36343]|uniref:hypothetical protein n=1 Tax=Parasediminibacterium sp. JCM 36343 TaxID=3374279 RepID=UPI00397912FD
MMTVRGVYENGKIELLQQVNAVKKQKVLITFIEEADNEEEQRLLSLQNINMDMQDYLLNDKEDLYQDYLKKK